MADDSPTLEQLIQEHREKLAQLRATIERAQMELNRVETELSVLNGIREERAQRPVAAGQGRLQGVMKALESVGSAMATVSSERNEFRNLDRAAAVERVLSVSKKPLSPTEIEHQLQAFGRDDEYDSISAALAYLKRTGRAHTPRRGEWVAGSEPHDGSDRHVARPKNYHVVKAASGSAGHVVHTADGKITYTRATKGGEDP